MPASRRAKAKITIKKFGKVKVIDGVIPKGASLPRTLHKSGYVVFPWTSTKSKKLVRRIFKSKSSGSMTSETPLIWTKGVPYLVPAGKAGVWYEIFNGDDHGHRYTKIIQQ